MRFLISKSLAVGRIPMGTDDLFKKRRAKLQERKAESKTPKPNSFLIVTEGTKTEPFYFNGLANYINELYQSSSIQLEQPTIETCGEGKNTVSLVNEASRIVARSPIVYEQVWVVFDKDDFKQFDEAIALAEDKDFHVGWSNQSFEYWIYLHFNYSDSALHRSLWCEKLDQIFKERKISDEGYEKNLSNIFDIATQNGSLKYAIGNAIRIEQSYDDRTLPSKKDPCTTVYKLIQQLKPYIEPLIK